MPIYRIRIHATQPSEQRLGFYQDRAATEYARRIARGAAAEVWRDSELVARLQANPVAEPAL